MPHLSTFTPLYLIGCGDHHHAVDHELPDLKELTQQVTGKSFRRIGRFIQLALIGAARCAHQPEANTAVYLSSGRGDLELTLDIMTTLFTQGQHPKPLSFVNTVSNAASFYVAQMLALTSSSQYVCNLRLAFEHALLLAVTQLHNGMIPAALVGSVDVATTPTQHHRQRLGLSASAPLGEGSHWVWLSREAPSNHKVLGKLLAVQHFIDQDEMLQWATEVLPANTSMAQGQFVTDTEWQSLHAQMRLTEFRYRDSRPYYDSHSGAALGEFLRSSHPSAQMLHINSDGQRGYCVMLVSR